MGIGKYLDPNERCGIHSEGLWINPPNEVHYTIAISLIYPLRNSSFARSIPDLPSNGSGLER